MSATAPLLCSTLLTVADVIALEPPQWIARDYLRRRDLALLRGEPGSAKSLALTVAPGTRWLGVPTQADAVVYVAAEGVHSPRARLLAALAGNVTGTAATRFVVVPGPLRLAEPDTVLAFVEELKRLPEPAALFVVDPLSRCLAGADGSGPLDMTRATAVCDRIRRRSAATLLLVDQGEGDVDSSQGASLLGGAADVVRPARARGRPAVTGMARHRGDCRGKARPFPLIPAGPIPEAEIPAR